MTTTLARYQVLPPLSEAAYAALKADIRESGRVRDPVVENREGSLLDGHHRKQIYEELRAEGVALAPLPRLIREDLGDDDVLACRAAARQYNLQRRHLGQTAKRALVADQLRETPDRTNSWIADQLAVSKPFVGRVRDGLVAAGVIPAADVRRTRDGSARVIPGSATERRLNEAVASELRRDPNRTDEVIARAVGADRTRVWVLRRRLVGGDEVPLEHVRVGVDGKRHPPRLVEPPPPLLAEQPTGELRREHSRLRRRLTALDRELRGRPREPREPPRGWSAATAARAARAGITLDVADAADLGARVPDGTVDLLVTSPPWNLDMAYDGAADDHDYAELFGPEGLVARWAAELFRVAGPQGRLCLNVPLQSWIRGAPRPVAADWLTRLRDAGWQYRSTILWLKSGAGVKTSGVPVVGQGTPRQPVVGTPATDVVLVLHKGAWKLEREGTHDLGPDDWPAIANGVWTFPAAHRERDEDGLALHPAPFPEELVRRCLVLFSYQDALVCDPFVGSGTSAVVAARLGRRCLGFDVSEAYVALARRRLEAALAGEPGVTEGQEETTDVRDR